MNYEDEIILKLFLIRYQNIGKIAQHDKKNIIQEWIVESCHHAKLYGEILKELKENPPVIPPKEVKRKWR